MTDSSAPVKGTTVALLLAAGAGRRMGFDKIIAPLAGRPVITWSLEAFQNCPDIDRGVLVCAPGRIEEFQDYARPYPKFDLVVAGGAERTESVLNGLAAIESLAPTLVATHDGARPLITPAMISAVVGVAVEFGSAVLAQPVADTLHRAAGSARLIANVPRQDLWAMQTPQVAEYQALRTALLRSQEEGRTVTDDISALLATGHQPHAVSHNGLNFKITWPRDLELAEAVLRQRGGGGS